MRREACLNVSPETHARIEALMLRVAAARGARLTLGQMAAELVALGERHAEELGRTAVPDGQ